MQHLIGTAADKAATKNDLQAARAGQRDHTAAGRPDLAQRAAATADVFLDEWSRRP